MENKTNGEIQTKDEAERGLLISRSDAEEFRAYKRQKRIGEIMMAISRSATPIGAKEDAVRIAERATRLRQAAVKITPSRFVQARDYLTKNHVKIDMIVGGNGETLAKVKAFEAKAARKLGASELTVVATPSLVATCRYGEIKKELKKIARAAKGVCLKVWIDKNYPFTTIARMARISAEVGAKYFCVPYFAGCERLRYDLSFGCLLEISDVETLADFKKMAAAGMGRIVSSHISEIYAEWLKEVEAESIFTSKEPVLEKKKELLPEETGKTEERPLLPPPAELENKAKPSEKPCVTALKGSDLKFL